MFSVQDTATALRNGGTGVILIGNASLQRRPQMAMLHLEQHRYQDRRRRSRAVAATAVGQRSTAAAAEKMAHARSRVVPYKTLILRFLVIKEEKR